ncbi:MAG: DUF485 domain-containing protein [Pirellula sp.]|jgi:uncharacterized membrane protein (DUF485 family)
MMHENKSSLETETAEQLRSRQRLSLWLLAFFTAVYAVFIGLCAFAYNLVSRNEIAGVPVVVWYGLGLILLAIAIAGLYGRLTRVR